MLGKIIGFLFGGSSAGEKTVGNVMDAAKGVGNWIDEQQFTDEEKSAAHLENTKMVIQAVESTRGENSARAVTRRVLAWSIMGNYLLVFNLCVVLVLFKHKDLVKEIRSLVDSFSLGELALAVGSFYFLVSLVRARK